MKAPCAILGALLVLCGCATSPHTDRQFGSSLRQLRAQQTLDPDAAARHPAVVAGVDADTARSIYDNYQRSYRTPERSVANGSAISAGIGTR